MAKVGYTSEISSRNQTEESLQRQETAQFPSWRCPDLAAAFSEPESRILGWFVQVPFKTRAMPVNELSERENHESATVLSSVECLA